MLRGSLLDRLVEVQLNSSNRMELWTEVQARAR